MCPRTAGLTIEPFARREGTASFSRTIRLSGSGQAYRRPRVFESFVQAWPGRSPVPFRGLPGTITMGRSRGPGPVARAAPDENALKQFPGPRTCFEELWGQKVFQCGTSDPAAAHAFGFLRMTGRIVPGRAICEAELGGVLFEGSTRPAQGLNQSSRAVPRLRPFQSPRASRGREPCHPVAVH